MVVMARMIETLVVVAAIPRVTVTDATLAMAVSGSRGRLEAAMAVVVGLSRDNRSQSLSNSSRANDGLCNAFKTYGECSYVPT